jgi:putative restriction endonuclease
MSIMDRRGDRVQTGDMSPVYEAFDGFGHVPGVAEGAEFGSRAELAERKVHRPLQAGICGTVERGAESVVLSGGYEDDYDGVDEIIYTGHGGRDSKGRQVKDQEPTTQNLSLRTSWKAGAPVRVIRAKKEGRGYIYDGLYYVEQFWVDQGVSGHRIFRSKLVRASVGRGNNRDSSIRHGASTPSGQVRPERRSVTTQRIVRTTKIAESVKAAYDHKCQVCGIQLFFGDSVYAEAAHIRPLGKPHDGPDQADNILCLCPNHHVLLDRGGMVIDEDFIVTYVYDDRKSSRLTVQHAIRKDHLRYHREYHRKIREVSA